MAILIGILLMIAAVVWNGFVGSVIWNWIVPVVFESGPTISVPAAILLSAIVGFWTRQELTVSDNRTTEEKLIAGFNVFLAPLVLLVLCWIVKQFL